MSPEELISIGSEIILGNTYHLYLRPGDKLIRKMGGLHKFAHWPGPILTDSGGFQVFSLGLANKNKKNLVKIGENGVTFQSHLDGSRHLFTPQKVLDIQNNLGSDIAMVLDECAPGRSDKKYATEAMARTHAWAKQAADYAKKKKFKMAIFGIVQGVTYDDLRATSAEYINSLGFDGNAIGGLAVGESKSHTYRVLETVIPRLDENRPRYLMGVGEPEDILEAVERGVDMFDCVAPTRIARNGQVITFGGKLNMMNAKFKTDKGPIEKDCDCYACQNFSRGYIRHLLVAGEVLGIRLTTIHNLRFMMRFMEEIRSSINSGDFKTFKKKFLQKYKSLLH
jgi:queuine tRNA-ribosyltransferase